MDFKRFVFSILRFGNSHGFGVQSPFAYRFIKDVAMEAYPYYGYTSLEKRFPDDDKKFFHRFLLRFSNYMQSKPWCLLDADNVDLAYIASGCKKFNLISTVDGNCEALVVKDMTKWKVFRSQYSSFVTFDLYDCGVVFFDRSVQSGHYKCVLMS